MGRQDVRDGLHDVYSDIGGNPYEYQPRINQYNWDGTEIRAHKGDFYSSGTLVLGVKNLAISPSAKFHLHAARNPYTHVVNDEVTRQLYASYPKAVQAEIDRQGGLKRDTHINLTGKWLLDHGVGHPLGSHAGMYLAQKSNNQANHVVAAHAASPQNHNASPIENFFANMFAPAPVEASHTNDPTQPRELAAAPARRNFAHRHFDHPQTIRTAHNAPAPKPHVAEKKTPPQNPKVAAAPQHQKFFFDIF